MDEMKQPERPFATYTSQNPALRFYINNVKHRFENGVYHCNTQDEAVAMEQALLEMAPAGRSLIRKLDYEAAEAIVQRHRQTLQQAAHQGPFTSQAGNKMVTEAAAAIATEEALAAGADPAEVAMQKEALGMDTVDAAGQPNPPPAVIPGPPVAKETGNIVEGKATLSPTAAIKPVSALDKLKNGG